MIGGMVDEGVDYAILAMGCDSTHKRYFRIASMVQFDHRQLSAAVGHQLKLISDLATLPSINQS